MTLGKAGVGGVSERDREKLSCGIHLLTQWQSLLKIKDLGSSSVFLLQLQEE